MSGPSRNGEPAGGDEDREVERPDEARLGTYLAEVGQDPPTVPGTALVQRVGRSARWQKALRAPLQAVGLLAAAVADGIATLLGARTERRHR